MHMLIKCDQVTKEEFSVSKISHNLREAEWHQTNEYQNTTYPYSVSARINYYNIFFLATFSVFKFLATILKG